MANALLASTYPLTSLLNGLQPSSLGAVAGTFCTTLPTKRHAFFSFQFDDVMRVNNVRQAWKIKQPDAASIRSFYDSSLWENRQLEADESVKDIIGAGVRNTSAVCVLVGQDTWERRWVRYEIARAVIDKRGLLAVHLNNLNHHERRTPDLFGPNPLDYMAVVKTQKNALSSPQYYLYEWTLHDGRYGWFRYEDYSNAVMLPPYLREPALGEVVPLSRGTRLYDFVQQGGHRNIGAWIDQAVLDVGR
jgi:hypothetical protein